jgi:hypothetical protein
MKVTAISGYGVKGPACFLLEIDGRRLLLDCGEGPEPGVRPDVARIGHVDAIVISHSHRDHTGALVLASQLGNPPIWSTPIVADLVDLKRHGQIFHLPYAGAASIEGLELLTGRAGHAPGAVWIRIGGEQGLLYSGDVSDEGVLYPFESLPKAAGLVVDSSYGTYEDPLARGIDTITQRAATGPLLLPAPAGGRGLEMAVVLHESGFAVGLCPAHVQVAELLIANETVLREGSGSRLRAMFAAASKLDAESAPVQVMVAAGADGESGLAGTLIDRFERGSDIQIVFTGHLPAASKGRELVDAKRAEFIRWNVHPTFQHLREMIRQTGADRVLTAFLSEASLPSLAASLGLGLRLSGGNFEL